MLGLDSPPSCRAPPPTFGSAGGLIWQRCPRFPTVPAGHSAADDESGADPSRLGAGRADQFLACPYGPEVGYAGCLGNDAQTVLKPGRFEVTPHSCLT
jgi:hypothetical protein